MTSLLLFEYDGTDFAGWAAQPNLRTVQDVVERALGSVLGEDRIPVVVAGRTDRGVHAWGQVCSYEHEAIDPLRLNAVLPSDIAVLESVPTRPGFDAREDAVSRTYCFRVLVRRTRSTIWPGRALWCKRPLDFDRLQACASLLIGVHDFTAFTPSQTEHVRFRREVFTARWERDGDLLEFWITANSFLRHMNRIVVGTMLEVASGRRTLESFASLLNGAPRAHAGSTAAPHGLALASVAYSAQDERVVFGRS